MQKFALALALVASLGTVAAAPAVATPAPAPAMSEAAPSSKGQDSPDRFLCKLFRACP